MLDTVTGINMPFSEVHFSPKIEYQILPELNRSVLIYTGWVANHVAKDWLKSVLNFASLNHWSEAVCITLIRRGLREIGCSENFESWNDMQQIFIEHLYRIFVPLANFERPSPRASWKYHGLFPQQIKNVSRSRPKIWWKKRISVGRRKKWHAGAVAHRELFLGEGSDSLPSNRGYIYISVSYKGSVLGVGSDPLTPSCVRHCIGWLYHGSIADRSHRYFVRFDWLGTYV